MPGDEWSGLRECQDWDTLEKRGLDWETRHWNTGSCNKRAGTRESNKGGGAAGLGAWHGLSVVHTLPGEVITPPLLPITTPPDNKNNYTSIITIGSSYS